MRRGQLTGALGRILLCVGTVILLFVAYQLWGTAVAESHSQAVLRNQLEPLLRGAERSDRHLPITVPVTAAPSGPAQVVPVPDIGAPAPGRPVGILRIPKIGVDTVVVEGTDAADLRQGPGHYIGTPLPGEAGNAAIAGHRTTYGAPFYNLDALGRGDAIVLSTTQGVFTYSVERSVVVSPGDMSVLTPSAAPELTLTTCTPRFSASDRLVVQATLVQASVPPTQVSSPPPPIPPRRATREPIEGADLAGAGGDWLPAAGWGALVSALAGALWWLARRRRSHRWLVYAAGGVVVLIALFFFFGAVSPLLPASF